MQNAIYKIISQDRDGIITAEIIGTIYCVRRCAREVIGDHLFFCGFSHQDQALIQAIVSHS